MAPLTERPRRLGALIAALVALRFALPLALLHPAWEFHRDELLYFAMGDHLAFRMQFPPFIAAMAATSSAVFGDSVWAARVPAAAGGAALTAVVLLTLRRFGAGRGALLLAWLALAAAPVFLRSSLLFQPVIFDQLWATLALAGLLFAASDQEPRWWMLVGAALGLGLLTKLSVLMYGAVVLVVAVLHPALRAQLRSRWPWLAATLACGLGLPTLLGQLKYDWPFLKSMAALRDGQLEATSVGGTLAEQVLMLGGAALLAAAALTLGMQRRWREIVAPLALFWVLLLGLVLLQGGKAYYAAPAYPLLLGLGALVLADGGRRWISATAALVLLVTGALLAPMGVPMFAPERMATFAARLGAGRTSNLGEQLALPQDYADMLGWRAQAEAMARAYATLSPEQQARVLIVGGNYGEAGALARYAPRFGYPYPVSMAGDFHAWGLNGRDGSLSLLLDDASAAETLGELFASVTVLDSFRHPLAVPEQQEMRIYLAEAPRLPLDSLWWAMGANWR